MSWVAAALPGSTLRGHNIDPRLNAACGIPIPISPRVYEPLLCSFSHGSWCSSLMRKSGIGNIAPLSWAFLIASGVATGASWLCYFKALSLGECQ